MRGCKPLSSSRDSRADSQARHLFARALQQAQHMAISRGGDRYGGFLCPRSLHKCADTRISVFAYVYDMLEVFIPRASQRALA